MTKWSDVVYINEIKEIQLYVDSGLCPDCTKKKGESVRLFDTMIGKGFERILACEGCRKLYLYWRK